MTRPLDDQADEPTADEPTEVSWGPTFGPETEADAARGRRRPRQPKPVEPVERSWHPPGGMW
jgi:hypothetical protein